MKGAVAAGHQLTAEAGARILAEGGNAVDACIAAAFMSWVAESPLTGPGAGGFMLVHRARDRSTRLLDFFVATPGLGVRARRRAEMESVDVDFSGESTQMFHIGSASCAVPGAVAGLAAAHRRYASLPWRTLIEPAVEAARRGHRADAAAGVSARDSRPDPSPHGRGAARLRHARCAPRARRRPAASRPCGHARAPGRATGRSVRRRTGGGGRPASARYGRRSDDGRSRGVPRDLADARANEVPRLHVRVESAAVVRRCAHRLRARPARPASEAARPARPRR